MDIRTFFESGVVKLPRQRRAADYEQYLARIFRNYRNEVQSLDDSYLGNQIRDNLSRIDRLSEQLRAVVRHYLEHQLDTAYEILEEAFKTIAKTNNLVSSCLSSSYWTEYVEDLKDCRRLYRMVTVKPDEQLNKGRVFHVPFHLSNIVKDHRYGIAGVPFLYLCGWLRYCQWECGLSDDQLQQTAVAEFTVVKPVQILDFGYRPNILVPYAVTFDAQPGTNPAMEQFVVNYATCWPLLAACSVERLLGDSDCVMEYIVPQLVTEWVNRNTACDGIRFFSTKTRTKYPDIHCIANYAFPARKMAGITHSGHSQWLAARIEMTDPVRWQGPPLPLIDQFTTNRDVLKSMPKST